ncbi:icarapin-like [Monomorium pharaonis]|uniref:icarapin-like n=1 Tax=Monomorium pharaonis TaxID=307658 RepID=UPI001746BC67|nr:icarapin-like [Monomorium pharaonis]
MKTLHVLLVAACLVACARGYPSIGYDSDEDDFDGYFGGYSVPNLFSDYFNRLRQRIADMFLDPHSMTDFKIPEGANTTSTTKIINGHVVTINETTYTKNDALGGTAFRVRIIDIKPQNGTDNSTVEVNVQQSTLPPSTVKPEPSESRETVEDFNNEVSPNTETLTA